MHLKSSFKRFYLHATICRDTIQRINYATRFTYDYLGCKCDVTSWQRVLSITLVLMMTVSKCAAGKQINREQVLCSRYSYGLLAKLHHYTHISFKQFYAYVQLSSKSNVCKIPLLSLFKL